VSAAGVAWSREPQAPKTLAETAKHATDAAADRRERALIFVGISGSCVKGR
jgi:hypothetical protein